MIFILLKNDNVLEYKNKFIINKLIIVNQGHFKICISFILFLQFRILQDSIIATNSNHLMPDYPI